MQAKSFSAELPAPGHQPAAAGEPVAKILAVDDDAANLIAIEAMLADLGQPVVCARSGQEALRHLLKDDFAVVLLDVLMPGMDGYETASIIRGREKTRHVPIVFLSAMDEEMTQLMRGYTAGAVDFIFKPVNPLILRSKVSVFVELQKRAQEIRRQAALEKRLLADNLLVRDEQRRTEEALQRSLIQQSLVIEALPVVLYVASATDSFRTRRFIGGQMDALMGSGASSPIDSVQWLERVHPADLPRLMDAFVEEPRETAFSAEYRLRCADDQYRWFSDHATLSRDNPDELFGILLDISDRRLLEEQLAHAQKMEAIGEMTGGVAHDFNNMLSVIIGSLDRVLSKRISDPGTKHRLDLALQAARSCADLTKRLLGFARRQSLEPRAIKLADEVLRLRELVLRLVGGAAEVEIDFAQALWSVYVDASQLEAAIINLVINARDAMVDGGRIRLAAINRPASDPIIPRLGLAVGDYVEFIVTDTGTGMPPEIKARVFEPFFTTKAAGKGTGLGLSIIYGFVRQSGGAVTIDSAVGAGTSVSLFLPKASVPADLESQELPRIAPGAGLRGCHVLLVEDEDKVRELAKSLLEDMGCVVRTAESGDVAIRLLDEEPNVSILFTDCTMPGCLDGPGLAMEVRRRMPGLPVLFTSGVRGSVDRVGGDSRSVAFLSKPYTSKQLNRAILDLLGAARPRVVP